MSSPAIVLYDGQCAFCRKSVRILQQLDWRGRFRYQDARDTANLPTCADPLDPAKLLEEMHVVTPDHRHAHRGYRAIRWMAWRVPLLWPVAPFLHIPGMTWLGTRLYRWAARNRFKLVPCTHGVCTVPGVRPPGRPHE
jgi:predicted DCC family thiol-disulfide oxidoreductase YuxK